VHALRVICLVLVVAGAGCGDSDLARLEKVRDRACACKTTACADATLGDVPAPGSGEVPTLHAQRIAADIFRCVSKLHLDHADDGSGSDGSDGSGSDGSD
jgi:hypothetical protein